MAKPKAPSTQSFLEIDKIHDGVVYLKDKSMRKVVMSSSLNFALRSEGEQESLIMAFQDLINAVDFPMQILVQSRRVNLAKYLKNISDIAKKATDDYTAQHVQDYHNFLEEITKRANLMDKKFYIVVPYFPYIAGQKEQPNTELISKTTDKAINTLNQRTSVVEMGLKNIGINCIPLDTQGLIELYYISYNPGIDKFGYMSDASSLERSVVTKEFVGETPDVSRE
ncbi:MAG: hypothetical protein WCP14_02530 [bacterium]